MLFKLFLYLLDVKKPNNYCGLRPLIPYQGPAIDLLGGLQHPPDPQLLFALCAFHAHIIWAPSALSMSTFFSVLTPDCIYKNTKHNVLIYTQLQLLVVAESGGAENLFRHCSKFKERKNHLKRSLRFFNFRLDQLLIHVILTFLFLF